MSLSWVLVLKLSKIVSFLQVLADVSEKPKSVMAIYVYAFESSCFALLENGNGYYAMSSVSFLLSQYFFWYFIPQYLMNGCSDPYKTYYFLKELDEVFQMDINKLLRFRFLAEFNINLQKIPYCWQSKDYNSGRKKGNLLLFCLIFIFVFEKW